MSRGEQVMVDLPRLVDLSVGTPNIGNINSALLHTLLHTIIRRLEMEDYRVEFRGSSALLVRELLPMIEEPPLFLTEYALQDNERIVVPPPKSGQYPTNVYVAEKRAEMNKEQVRKLQDVMKRSSARPKMFSPDEKVRRIDEAVMDINAAISDVLPQLMEEELAKYVDLKARIETMERQIRYLTNMVETERDDFLSRPGSVKSDFSQVSEKRAPGFLAKEQMDLVCESLLRDKDGRLFAKLEDKIRNTLIRDVQRDLMKDLFEKMKHECCKDKITHDTVNHRLQQIESDLLKAMKDMEDMLNKCQGDEIRNLLDSRLADFKDRLHKLEKSARKSSAASSSLTALPQAAATTTTTATCDLCPESKCLTCCQIAAQSGKTTPTPPLTPKSAGSRRSAKEVPRTHPRRLSQKSKSEIQFDPSFFVQGCNDQNYKENREANVSMEEIKPVPPAKTRGRYFSKSRSLSHPECDQCAQECSWCLNEQMKARTLPCGCYCSEGEKVKKKKCSKSARTSRSSSKEKTSKY